MDKRRFSAVIVFIIAAGLIFAAALFKLQILDYKFFKNKAENQQRRFIKVATDRGDIFTRDGEILATSLNRYSIYINPQIFKDYKMLSNLVSEEVKTCLPTGRAENADRYFVWVKRKVNSQIADAVKEAKIPGVGIVLEKKRYYPNADFAAQVLGFTGMDNEGLAGVELSLDEYLRAKEGLIKTYADPVGFEFLAAKRVELEPEEEGLNVYLTIDQRVQHAAERELKHSIEQFKANSGTAIVMDIKTGEILALASKPDFDPNKYSEYNPQFWNSRACLVFEPGSTFKLITAASALDENAVGLDTKLKALDKIVVGGKTISNSHQIKWPGSEISLSYMLEQSINTGAVQVAQKLGKEKFYKHIKAFGFGAKTDFGLAGESSGILRNPKNWYKPDIAMISFGQSIAVTPIQLISAISALGRGGEVVKPQLIRRIESRDGTFIKTFPPQVLNRAVSSSTAKAMLGLMRNVVLYGSGRRVQIKYFGVAGKTGTAQKTGLGKGYLKGHYVASFIGLAPMDNPRISCLVILDDPKGSIWGESTAGPVFQKIMSGTLRFYNIKPDLL